MGFSERCTAANAADRWTLGVMNAGLAMSDAMSAIANFRHGHARRQCRNLPTTAVSRCSKRMLATRTFSRLHVLKQQRDAQQGLTAVCLGQELSVFNLPHTVRGCLPAAAVTEAGASSPSTLRVWSVVIPVTETMVAVPVMVVRVRVMAIVPMFKSVTSIITIPVPIVFARALSFATVAAPHSGAMHREAIHPLTVAAPCATSMKAATAASQRGRVA
jgi:hypothetical protein